MRGLLILICFLKLSISSAPSDRSYWLIWNVGQGQWVTEVRYDTCTHYDFGGEVSALKSLRMLFKTTCQNKQNQFILSHGDLDHYAFFNFIRAQTSRACWLSPPTDELKRIRLDAPLCSQQSIKTWSYHPEHEVSKNDSSQVVVRNGFLLPGDSSKKMELRWISKLPQDQIQILILGHHGSRTSTSQQLIHALPHLKFAIASARHKKYGHPHSETITLLKQLKIPLLKTEDWGTIQIENL